jgi:hypothetical protein
MHGRTTNAGASEPSGSSTGSRVVLGNKSSHLQRSAACRRNSSAGRVLGRQRRRAQHAQPVLRVAVGDVRRVGDEGHEALVLQLARSDLRQLGPEAGSKGEHRALSAGDHGAGRRHRGREIEHGRARRRRCRPGQPVLHDVVGNEHGGAAHRRDDRVDVGDSAETEHAERDRHPREHDDEHGVVRAVGDRYRLPQRVCRR